MPKERILVMDVGNTSMKIAIADSAEIGESFTLPTSQQETADSWGMKIREVYRLLEIQATEGIPWVISSVVPSVNPLLRQAAGRFFRARACFVPEELELSIENKYSRPQEVGADRLVGAFAARRLFDTASIIVVDFGSATTFDCVSGNAYLGGLICPGVQTSAQALSSRTAKLPQITLEVEQNALRIGQSTSESMNQGFFYGFSDMAEGLIKRLKATLPSPATVVATGGFAESLSSAVPSFDVLKRDLILQGLRLAYFESR